MAAWDTAGTGRDTEAVVGTAMGTDVARFRAASLPGLLGVWAALALAVAADGCYAVGLGTMGCYTAC